MTTIPGKRGCQCAACGAVFGSVQGFDRHRAGGYRAGRRCLTAAEIAALRDGRGRPVLRLDDRGVWVRAARMPALALPAGLGAAEGAARVSQDLAAG